MVSDDTQTHVHSFPRDYFILTGALLMVIGAYSSILKIPPVVFTYPSDVVFPFPPDIRLNKSRCFPHHLIPKSFRLFALSPFSYEPWALILRLYVMANYTDKFVLGWSNVTFLNKPKPPPNFKPFEDEIYCYRNQIHMHFVMPPDFTGMNDQQIGSISDAHYKDRLVDALPDIGATPNDMIFFADTDEFPTFEALKNLIKNPNFNGIQRMETTQFFYNFRREERWDWPWIAPYFIYLRDLGEQKLFSLRLYGDRRTPTNKQFHAIHISYAFPTLEGFRRKLLWQLVKQYAVPPYITYEHIFSHIACGLELFDRLPMVDRHAEFVKYIPALPDSRLDFLRPDFDAAFDDLGKVDVKKLPHTPRTCPQVMQLYDTAKQQLVKRKASPRFRDQTDLVVMP